MTQKDFIALAAALKATKPPTISTDIYTQWCFDVMAVIGVLTQANPRFHRGRFIAACGIPNIEHVDKLKQEIINYHMRVINENDEGE